MKTSKEDLERFYEVEDGDTKDDLQSKGKHCSTIRITQEKFQYHKVEINFKSYLYSVVLELLFCYSYLSDGTLGTSIFAKLLLLFYDH